MSVSSKMAAIADAIREKTGSTDELTLDGMVEAIAGIEAGGGSDDSLIAVVEGSAEEVSLGVTSIKSYLFYRDKKIKKITLPQATSIGYYSCRECTSIAEINAPNLNSIGDSSFYRCSSLKAADFPQVTDSTGYYAFFQCTNLVSANFPLATILRESSLRGCSKLTTVNLPQVVKVEAQALMTCKALKTLDLPKVTVIKMAAFSECSLLNTLVLRVSEVCTLDNTNAFSITPIENGTGYIYVPDALVDDYKAATNWSVFADQIRPLSEYAG